MSLLGCLTSTVAIGHWSLSVRRWLLIIGPAGQKSSPSARRGTRSTFSFLDQLYQVALKIIKMTVNISSDDRCLTATR